MSLQFVCALSQLATCACCARICASLCAAFLAAWLAGGNLEPFDLEGVVYVQVLLGGNRGTVADPIAVNMQGESGRQFGLPARPQVVEQPGPGLQACPFDDAQESRSQVCAFGWRARCNDFASRLGLISGLFQAVA